MSNTPALIAVDWGSSSFRGYLLSSNGDLLDRVAGPAGILTVSDSDFAHVLRTMCAAWIAKLPSLPILMCGMIGSRQGWQEAEYVSGDIGAAELAAASALIKGGPGIIRIVPGVKAVAFDGGPDVMRGEETILVGAFSSGASETALYCMPGTHSKWVSASNGRIGSFSTFLTGELFAMLSERSVLSDLIGDGKATTDELRKRSFVQGLRMAEEQAHLTHQLFSIRAMALTEPVATCVVEEVLSGLLIGTELMSVSRRVKEYSGAITLLASGSNLERYSRALKYMGHEAVVHDAEIACISGLYSIAVSLGLVSSIPVGSQMTPRRSPA